MFYQKSDYFSVKKSLIVDTVEYMFSLANFFKRRLSLFASFFPFLFYNKPLIYKFRIASHHRICAKRVQSLCAPQVR